MGQELHIHSFGYGDPDAKISICLLGFVGSRGVGGFASGRARISWDSTVSLWTRHTESRFRNPWIKSNQVSSKVQSHILLSSAESRFNFSMASFLLVLVSLAISFPSFAK